MYGNLRDELRRKNISQRAVANLLNCTEKTVFNKISGATEFTIGEAFLIHKNLLPEFGMEYIFSSSSAPSAPSPRSV